MKALKSKVRIERPERERVSREEALKRIKAFTKRKEKLVAAIRNGAHCANSHCPVLYFGNV